MSRHLLISLVLLWAGVTWPTVLGSVDVSLPQLEYIADHLTREECRQLVAALHEAAYDDDDFQRRLASAESRVPDDVPCLNMLLHWNSAKGEGRGETHTALAHRLSQIKRRDLANWLSKTSFHQLAKDLDESLLQDPFKDIAHSRECRGVGYRRGKACCNNCGSLFFADADKRSSEDVFWDIADTIGFALIILIFLVTQVFLGSLLYKLCCGRRGRDQEGNRREGGAAGSIGNCCGGLFACCFRRNRGDGEGRDTRGPAGESNPRVLPEGDTASRGPAGCCGALFACCPVWGNRRRSGDGEGDSWAPESGSPCGADGAPCPARSGSTGSTRSNCSTKNSSASRGAKPTKGAKPSRGAKPKKGNKGTSGSSVSTERQYASNDKTLLCKMSQLNEDGTVYEREVLIAEAEERDYMNATTSLGVRKDKVTLTSYTDEIGVGRGKRVKPQRR